MIYPDILSFKAIVLELLLMGSMILLLVDIKISYGTLLISIIYMLLVYDISEKKKVKK